MKMIFIRNRFTAKLLTFILATSWMSVRSQDNLGEYIRIISQFHVVQNYTEAIFVCDKAIALFPGIAELYYFRGIEKFYNEDFSSSIEDFDKAIELDAGFSEAFLYRSKAKAKCGKFIGAIRDMNSARSENFYKTLFILAGDMFTSMFSGQEEKKEKVPDENNRE